MRTLVTRLFGDDQHANIFLVGMACQAGAIPVDAAHIESAIELNGVAVERNQQAFRRGRQLVADPDAFDKALPAGPPLLRRRPRASVRSPGWWSRAPTRSSPR